MITGLHHVAIAVKDLEATARFYREVFGLPEPEKTETVQEQGVKACLISLGNSRLELLEPVQPESTVGRFLQRNGEGLHHVCFETDSVDEELRRMASRGIELIDREPRQGLAGMIGFLHPKSTGNVLIELVQTDGGAAATVTRDGRTLRVLIAK